MLLKNDYYFNALSWSIICKVITSVFGFISTPLLLGYFGKADFGLLSIATACNGYMHILDLGMNTGAVRHYSIWKAEGKTELIYRVARTNITFYGLISVINILFLILLAYFGEGLFAVSHNQFITLRICLFILALFNVFSWETTVFNQLLIADKRMTFAMKMNCLVVVARVLLLISVFAFQLELSTYFFFLTACIASLFVPFFWKCQHDKLIDSIKPACFWTDFKPVIIFSLSIFALSLFQMTAIQSRPIILSIFASDGASCVTDYQIISVFPSLIITIGSTFSSVFLPKTSEMVAKGCLEEQHIFAYKWTILTTIIANCLCFPFVLGASDIISAYVGRENVYLAPWLILWVFCTLLQIHSTPTNALILGYGKTKVMIFISGIACFISMAINALFANHLSVGSAVIGYCVYIIINFSSYYGYYYHKTLQVSNVRIFTSFAFPTICGIIVFIFCYYMLGNLALIFVDNPRINFLVTFFVKGCIWFIMYIAIIYLTGIVKISNKTIKTKYDK